MTNYPAIQKNNGEQAVNARDLHAFLESKQEFANWIKQRIEKYGLTENEDFLIILSKTPNGRPLTEYALTLDAAKELSMVEGNAKGKQARKYFIEKEKEAKQLAKPLSTLDMLEMSIKQLREQDSRVSAIENKVLEIEAKTATRPEYFTIIGYATLNKIQVGLQLASKLGQKAARICKEKGYPTDEIPDPRFGRVKSYPKLVLQQVFNEAVC